MATSHHVRVFTEQRQNGLSYRLAFDHRKDTIELPISEKTYQRCQLLLSRRRGQGGELDALLSAIRMAYDHGYRCARRRSEGLARARAAGVNASKQGDIHPELAGEPVVT